MSIKAKRCVPAPEHAEHATMIPSVKEPGEFYFADQGYNRCHPTDIPPGAEGRFVFACLKRGGFCGEIIIGNGFKPQHGAAPTWQWDGNADKPTLTPSINCRGCWHGWLTAGEFKEC